ncbi:MAG TPA: SCO family protein [Ktedonobacteraceae bacterium]|nr:SCO family protein [Ktedonobacteraceae bacterium]
MNIHINWRLASRLSVITLAILVVILVTLLQHKNTTTSSPSIPSDTAASSSGLQGSDLGGQPAPDFVLTDQYGKQVSLAQFKGKPVVLTFLYTHCPDVCPLTAEKLHSTILDLGNDAQNVAVLAVSTDPKRDTMQSALDFSKAHGMQNYWHFLIGTEQKLAPIWSDYSIYAQAQQQTVDHSLAIYVIDKQGRERVYLGNDFIPTQLANNLKTLLKE